MAEELQKRWRIEEETQMKQINAGEQDEQNKRKTSKTRDLIYNKEINSKFKENQMNLEE